MGCYAYIYYKFKSVFHKNVFAKTIHTDPIFDTIEICEVLGSKIWLHKKFMK